MLYFYEEIKKKKKNQTAQLLILEDSFILRFYS